MSREFTKMEQHRLAKTLLAGLSSFMTVALSAAKRYSEIAGVTFSWYGPKANRPQEPSIAVFTLDRTIVVRKTARGRIVAFSEKNVGRSEPGTTKQDTAEEQQTQKQEAEPWRTQERRS